MVVVAVRLTLRLEGVRSLKQKRAIVRSLVERLRTRRQLSAAEVGAQDCLQHAEVGFAVVSGEHGQARGLVEDGRRFVDLELVGKGEVVDTAIEELTVG